MSYRFAPSPIGLPALIFAIGLPIAAILCELVAGWCASLFFDPLPTFLHLLLVASVPIVNLLLWMIVREEGASGPRWLAVAAGVAIAVATTYTVLLLPILPISVPAILLFGLGLLPFAPLAALVFAVRSVRRIRWKRPVGRLVALGVVLGIAVSAAADAPATAVHLAVDRYGGSDDDRRSAVRLMRAVGSRDLLLRLAYGEGGRVTGLLGAFTSLWSHGPFNDVTDRSTDARELYYRVTGEAYNARAKPVTGLAARADWFNFDRDLGGEQVGARVPGLSLTGSRIDGSAAVADNLAYVEWTVEVANAADIQNEARFTLAMPEGAVASRATLWVNGEPREASVAGRAAVRAAYQRVVSARRDPLLVTTDGAGRLLVQAFPIAPHATMKLRIGYTAPFVVAGDGTRTQALPAIVERNFEIADELRHHVWIDGDAPLGTKDTALSAAGTAVRGILADTELLARRSEFTASALVTPSLRTGLVAAANTLPPLSVEQRISPSRGDASAVMILFDASAPMAATGAALAQALDAIPAGLPVGLTVAADDPVTIPPAPWSSAQRTRMLDALKALDYRGGQDDLEVLADAAARVAQPGGRVIWVHGAQPVDGTRSRAALEQLLSRATVLPELIRYQAVPGRATTMTGQPLFETARMVTPGTDPVADLRAIFTGLRGPVWRTDYRPIAAGTGSPHILRLWAARELAANAMTTGKARDLQISLARRLNVVTPVSGAVVLETDRDYRANDLPVPSADDVPTIPEPETWALLVILALAAGWLWRRRARVVAA
ncbi:VIT domain-containing protein [Sphingomonas floccifaciens]|uniref:VIT domain-containing protein n=1 Tax=Sphingomonas floccifaciens TaxID=1844115 RepID=A0ABW4N855_9SPHN